MAFDEIVKTVSLDQEVGSYTEDEEAIPLRDLDFTDLLISEAGAAKIRGLSGEKGSLVQVPGGVISDLESIHKRVCSMGQLENEFALEFDNVRYRASKIEGQDGVWYVLRRLMWPIPRFSSLGMHSLIRQAIGRLGKRPHRGLILIAGGTGNGKTTTASSLLQEYLLYYGDIAVTIEDPPELKMEGSYGPYGQCFQVKVKDGDFTTPLRAAMRYSPRYIFLGELRDPAAASAALRAAISGHVVITTIHGGSIQEAITSVIKLVSNQLDMDLARQMLGDGLAAVIHQELKVHQLPDGNSERRPVMRTLFLEGNQGLRAKIREGKTELLETEIEAQQNRVVRGQPPVPQPGQVRGRQ